MLECFLACLCACLPACLLAGASVIDGANVIDGALGQVIKVTLLEKSCLHACWSECYRWSSVSGDKGHITRKSLLLIAL